MKVISHALPAAAFVAAASSAPGARAFVAPGASSAAARATPRHPARCSSARFVAGEESAFVADVEPPTEEGGEDKTFDAVEKMGRGAAKVRKGRDDARGLALCAGGEQLGTMQTLQPFGNDWDCSNLEMATRARGRVPLARA